MKRLSSFLVERGGLLALGSLALYVWLAPPFIVDGDNAEFATLSVLGGAAHPPGYPLYVLYLRATSWLPGETVAHTAAIATAILGALSVLVLHAACRAWGARASAATIACALFAGAPIVARLHCVAEVFALNDLLAALILWLAAEQGPLRGVHRVAVLALVAGLALANQQTCALLAPVGLLGAVRGVRETTGSRYAAAGAGVAGLVVGLSPYLYLFVAPRSPISWGHVDTLGDLIAHFTRRDYGGIGSFSPTPGEIDVGANLRAFAQTVGRAWLWAPALGGVAMLATGSWAGSKREGTWSWRMLTLSWLLAGPVLAARFDVLPEGIGLPVVQRFHLFAVVLLTVPVALAFERVLDRFTMRASLAHVTSHAMLVVAAALSLPQIEADHSPAVETGIRNMLGSMPGTAVILATGDDIAFGSHYLQDVCGLRRDVVVISWMSTTSPWYREATAARGIVIDPYAAGTDPPSVRVARQILGTGRPLFTTASPSNILKAFPSYPYGMLFRVLPSGQPTPSLDEIVELNRELFAGFDLDYPRPRRDARYAAVTHERYIGTWMILAKALADAGRRDDASAAKDIADHLKAVP